MESRVYRYIPDGYALGVSLPKNIERYRRALKMTQTTLGKKFGLGQGAISKWEKGQSKPDVNDLPALANALQVTVEDLLAGIDADYDVARLARRRQMSADDVRQELQTLALRLSKTNSINLTASSRSKGADNGKSSTVSQSDDLTRAIAEIRATTGALQHVATSIGRFMRSGPKPSGQNATPSPTRPRRSSSR